MYEALKLYHFILMAGMIIKEKMAMHKSISVAVILETDNKTAYSSYNSKNYIILVCYRCCSVPKLHICSSTNYLILAFLSYTKLEIKLNESVLM